jgi:hypothetical protein
MGKQSRQTKQNPETMVGNLAISALKLTIHVKASLKYHLSNLAELVLKECIEQKEIWSVFPRNPLSTAYCTLCWICFPS